MPRYSIQVVMGLAGSGSLPTVILFRNTARPRLRVGLPPQLSMANLDPAAEHFEYELIFDIRDLVSVAEGGSHHGRIGIMTEGCALILHGVFVENLDWLQEHLEQLTDDDFLLLNCHGQLEIYTHVQV